MSQSASRGQGKRSEGLYSDAVKGSSGKDKYFCPTQNTDYLSDQDIRNTGTNKHSGYNYTVPTSNRFNAFNQENYQRGGGPFSPPPEDICAPPIVKCDNCSETFVDNGDLEDHNSEHIQIPQYDGNCSLDVSLLPDHVTACKSSSIPVFISSRSAYGITEGRRQCFN